MKTFIKTSFETIGLACKFAICAFAIFVILYASTPRTIQDGTASSEFSEIEIQ